MGFIEKQKECNSKNRIVFLHSGECNSILLLHSWEIELPIRHHVTKINQLNDLNLTRYYIKNTIIKTTFVVLNVFAVLFCTVEGWRQMTIISETSRLPFTANG